MLAPSALALITALFSDAGERAKAVGLWMTCFMVGMAAGPIVGGLLLRWFWWGSVFLLGIPVMLALILLGPSLLPRGNARSTARTDLGGAALSALAVLAFVFGIKSVTAGNIPPVMAVAIVVAGLVCAGAFIVRLRRHPEPLVPIALFANRRFTAALCVMTVSAVAIGGSYFFFTQYLQLVANLSALHAGVVLVAPAVAFAAGAVLGPLLTARVPMHYVLAGGLVVAAIGLGTAAGVRSGDDLLLAVLGFSLAFLGFGPGAALGTDLVVGSARTDQAGSASALSETGTELGSALGVAVLGSLGAVLYRQNLNATLPHEAGTPALERALDGVITAETAAPGLAWAAESAYASAFGWIAAIAAGLLAVLAWVAIHALRPLSTTPTDWQMTGIPRPTPHTSNPQPKD